MTIRLARWRAAVAYVAVLALAATLLVATPARAEARPIRPEPDKPVSVSGRNVAPAAKPKPGAEEAAFLRAAPSVNRSAALAAPSGVTAQLLDQDAAARAGVNGLLLRVTGDQAKNAAVEVDYSGMRYAYGGDWASRLQVVRVHDGKVFPARNDVKSGKLRVELPVPSTRPLPSGLRADSDLTAAQAGLFAVTAAPSGANGSFQATTLSPSMSWQVGLNSGDFNWAYPITLPELPGLTPDVDLGYSSGAVDGRMAATNNQPSIVGEGFDLNTGFIERSYQSCKEDGHANSIELCYVSNNASVSLPGIGGQLVRDDATGIWRSEYDSGWRVELFTGASNGDNDGEHWRLTSPDGTQYFFGRSAAAKSTWTVPVAGDDAGEPCHGSGLEGSFCNQAYRWNLDYVVDTHGDALAYYYDTETNFYSRGEYVRSGHVTRIEYGFRDGATTPAPGRVEFVTAGRCIPGTYCDPTANPQHFPDVPLDLRCTAAKNCAVKTPTFWSTVRLAEIRTQVLVDSAYRDVASWTFNHQFPANGDGTAPGLWLESIVHTGLAGGTLSIPPVRFDGELRENRVDGLDMQYPFHRWRLNTITNETGGQIKVTYAERECTRDALPVPDSNTRSCYPGYWLMGGSAEPTLDWFQKTVVSKVEQIDLTGSGNATEVTEYEYLGGAGWIYDTSELTPTRFKTWGQFRGFQRTRVKHGDPNAGPQRIEEHLFLRGMDNDLLSNGSRRDVWVSDSQGGSVEDKPIRRGFTRETTIYNGDEWHSKTVSEPLEIRKTATRNRPTGPLDAYLTQERSEREYTRHPGGVWETETIYHYDDYGRVVMVDDRGDTSRTDDDTCARATYTQNVEKWILDTLARIEMVGVNCDTPPTSTDVISDERQYYDGATSLTAVPVKGDPTRAEEISEPGVYVLIGAVRYDPHGRPVESTDPSGDKTTIAFTPEVGGPVTQTRATDPRGDTVTTTIDPLLGVATSTVDANNVRSDMAYDPLGRVTAAWGPDRNKAAGQSASMTFSYLVRNNAPSVVTTNALLSNGSYLASRDLFDGFLRLRQEQMASPLGGRVISDTFYDSHGRVIKTNDKYWNDASGPSTTLFNVQDRDVPSQTRYIYDRAGRETDEILFSHGVEQWRTRTSYGPNWTAVDPPTGSTPTMEIFDIEGRTVELRQFHGDSPTGAYDATKYTYTRTDERETVTDAAGNVWRYSYDLRGRLVRAEDPDSGVSTYSYDDEDQQLTSTDSRGVTLRTTYDNMGRKTAEFVGETKIAEWTYDMLPNGKGKPVASIRYVDGHAYASEVTGYQQGTGRPLGTKVTIPAVEGGLAGTYETKLTYDSFGRLTRTQLPSAPGLPNETLIHGYNDLDMPATLTGLDPYLSDTMYDEFGRTSAVVYGGLGSEVFSEFGYDPVTGRLESATTLRNVPNDPLVSQITYTYDPAGNVLSSSDAISGDHQCFEYDYLRRLTEAWTPASGDCQADRSVGALGGPARYWHSFTYDKVGNRLSEVRHAAGGDTTRAYTYPAAGAAQPHTLKSVTTTGPGVSKTDTFSYDQTGNLLVRAGQDLTWDAEGQLASIGDTSFVYDADGNRLIRRDPDGTTLYLGDLEIRQTTSGGLSSTRYYGKSAVRTSAGITWLVSDHQGTANIAITASDLSETRRYQTPFGQSRGSAVSWPTERGFVGGTKDPSTGLIHLGAREYDPDTGRFISVDPIIDESDPQQMNPYAYANNSPVTFSDPDGLKYVCGNPRQCDGSDAKQAADAAKRAAAARKAEAKAAAERARRAQEMARARAAAQRKAAKAFAKRQAALEAKRKAEERRKERIRAKNKAAADKAAAKAEREKAKKEREAQRKRDAALAKCGGTVKACEKKEEEQVTRKACSTKAACEHYERRFIKPNNKKPEAKKPEPKQQTRPTPDRGRGLSSLGLTEERFINIVKWTKFAGALVNWSSAGVAAYCGVLARGGCANIALVASRIGAGVQLMGSAIIAGHSCARQQDDCALAFADLITDMGSAFAPPLGAEFAVKKLARMRGQGLP